MSHRTCSYFILQKTFVEILSILNTGLTASKDMTCPFTSGKSSRLINVHICVKMFNIFKLTVVNQQTCKL